MKVLTTAQLDTLNRDAIRVGRGRRLTGSFIASLDPDGYHVVDHTMLHNDGAAIRCHILVKFRGDQEAHTCELDVAVAGYNALPEHRDVMASLAREVKQ